LATSYTGAVGVVVQKEIEQSVTRRVRTVGSEMQGQI
jgi:hypothetical protein